MIVNGSPIDYSKIPAQHMAGAVKRYIENGIAPGGFMTAIITNDLRGAIMRADSTNSSVIKEWIWWFQEHAPAACWGSEEKMESWPTLLRVLKDNQRKQDAVEKELGVPVAKMAEEFIEGLAKLRKTPGSGY